MKNNSTNYHRIVTPLLKKFIKCNIYGFEIEQIDQSIADSVNQKTIYNALDSVDFKTIRQIRLENEILKLLASKLKLGKEIYIAREKDIKLLVIDKKKHQIVLVKEHTFPKISNSNYLKIFFIISTDYKKNYYCGKIEKLIDEDFDKNTNTFIAFDKLKI